MKSSFINKILPHVLAIAFFLSLTMVYLSPILKGKELKRHDFTVWKSMSQEANSFKEKTGETTQWTNSAFGGMPMYLTSPIRDKVFGHIDKIIRIWHNENLAQIFLYLLGFYLAMLVFGIRPWLAVAGAVAFAFSSYFFIIIQAGHGTKALTIGYMSPILAGVYLSFERKKPIAGALLTAFFLALQIRVNHFQITYYTLIAVLVFGLIWLIKAIKEKDYLPFVKSLLISLVGVILAVGVNITSIYTSYEYGKYSIRGPSELSHNQENKTSGLDKDYATAWSYGIDETFTFLVPNFKGGASGGALSEKSETYKLFEKAQGKTYAKKVVKQLPLYFGTQPVTSGPVYMGAIVCFLFILGMFLLRGPVRTWLIAITVVSVVLSWGRNFMTGDLIKYGLLLIAAGIAIKSTCKTIDKKQKQKYWIAAAIVAILGLVVASLLPDSVYNNPFSFYVLDYFPGYNKFRTVSMILVIAEFAIPLMAILAVAKALSGEIEKAQFHRSLYWSFGITAGLSIIFWLFAGSFNFVAPGDAGMQDVLAEALQADRQLLFKSDALRSFFFILLACGLLWGAYNNKIKAKLFYPLLIALLLLDMWPIDKRYLNDSHFVTQKQFSDVFAPTKADQYILKDTDPDFRVLNLAVSTFNDATTSQFHKSIGGYHGAKMRRYQELIDFHIAPEIQTTINKLNDKSGQFNPYQAVSENKVLNMLNTKYIIVNPESFPIVNGGALGSVWFVNKLTMVNNADEEINALYNFNPKTEAVVDVRYQSFVDNFTPTIDSTADIKLIEYKPNYLKYKSSAKADQLAVFSEIYYPKGWHVKIDGKAADHFRADYVLRGMVVPAGEHEIEFSFQPKSVLVCNTISLFSGIVLLLAAISALAFYLKQKKRNEFLLQNK